MRTRHLPIPWVRATALIALAACAPLSAGQGSVVERWSARQQEISGAVAGDDREAVLIRLCAILDSELADPMDPWGAVTLGSPTQATPLGFSESLVLGLVQQIGAAAPPLAVWEQVTAAPVDPADARLLRLCAFAASARAHPEAQVPDDVRGAAADALADALRTHSVDFARAQAAAALGQMGARAKLGDLRQALADAACRHDPARTGARADRYLVREAARTALLSLGAEVVSTGPNEWLADPDLVLGIRVPLLLEAVGLEASPDEVLPFGVSYSCANRPGLRVVLGVFHDTYAAADRTGELLGHGATRWGDHDRRGGPWVGPTAVVRTWRNVLCVVRDDSAESAEELAVALIELVRTSDDVAPRGRPVPLPTVALSGADPQHPGRFVRLAYVVRGGIASAWRPEPDSADSGQVGVIVGETEPGLCVRTFDFATPECVMVRKTVIIKVVPWEDDEPEPAEE